MPECYELFGVRMCFPTIDDIYREATKAVQDTVQPMLNQFFANLSSVFNESLSGVGNTIIQYIEGGFESFATDLTNALANVLQPVFSYLQGLWQGIEQLGQTASQILPYIKMFAEFYVKTYWGTIFKAVQTLPQLFSGIQESITNITGAITNIPGELTKLFDLGLAKVYELFETLINSANRLFADVQPAIASVLANVRNIADNAMNMIYEVMSKVSAIIHNTFIEPLREWIYNVLAGKPGSPPMLIIAFGIAQASVEVFWLTMKVIFEKWGKADKRCADWRSQAWLTMLTVYTTVDGYLRWLTDTMNRYSEICINWPVKLCFSLPDLEWIRVSWRSVYWNLGIGWITWTMFSSHARYLISEPYEKFILEKFRPKYPTLSQVQEAWRRGFFDDRKAKQWLAKLGYPDELHDTLLKLGAYYVPPSTIQEWYARGLIDASEAKEMLREYGVPEKYAVKYLESAHRNVTYVTLAEGVRKTDRGFSEFHRLMRIRGYHEDDIRYAWESMKRDLSIDRIAELVKRGEISRDEGYKLAYRAGYEKDVFDLYMKTETWIPSISQALDMFIQGLISKEELSKELDKHLVPEEYRDKLIEMAYTQLSRSTVEDLYIRGFIDDNEFVSRLRKLGYKEEDIELLKKSLAREVSSSTAMELYEWGVIDENKLTELLWKNGYREESLALMQELARIRKFGDEISLIKTRIARLFVSGYYTKEQAMQRLQALGYPQDQATLYLLAYDFARMADILDEFVRSLIQLYRDNKIDEASVRILLAPIVEDPMRIEALIAWAKALRKKRLPFIFPPVATERKELLMKAVRSIERQLKFMEKQFNDEMKEIEELIAQLEAEKEQVGEELKPIIEDEIRLLREYREAREQEFAQIHIKLIATYFAYKRILGLPIGEEVTSE